MAENNTVLVVAVLAVIASLAAAGFSYYSLSKAPGVVGYADFSEGTASLSVQTLTEINFLAPAAIAWGDVSFDPSSTAVTLDTIAGVSGGSAVGDPQTGLVLENDGNANVDVTLAAGKSAADFLGGTGPSYQWQVSDAGVRDGCSDRIIDSYADTNTVAQDACGTLAFIDSGDQMLVDVKLVVPYDTARDAKTDTITATAMAL